jgi:hypothetical protein
VRSYCASLIMQVKETSVSRGTSSFIMKADASPISSPITKAGASHFFTKAGGSPILYIEMSIRMVHLCFISPLKRNLS